MSINRIDPGARMSGAVVHGNTVYVAGQVGDGETVTEQCKDALAEVDRLLAAAGSDKSKILQTLIYLSDIRTYTVQLGLRTFVDSSAESDWGGLFAMSILTLVPVFVFFLFFQRLLIDGIATTGMKR